ncbi:hypothetical protein BS17DRAFT_789637, partial [Gyrodon lividus]
KSLEDIKVLKYVRRIGVLGFQNKVRNESKWHQNGGIMTEGNGTIIVKQGERELLIGTADVKKCQRKVTYVKR